MTAYYNEIDPYAATWLRNLIAAGLIAPGDVDERSIADVKPVELLGYTQCHFFAGIGVWSHALRRAGWSDDRPVWTGSCPCQPFSAAGKGGGEADERHLWPAFFHLIQHAKPRDVPVFGEQVASKPGLAWLDLVHADLEGQGYAVGAIDLCAAGVGAPHIRQRSFFVADYGGDGRQRQPETEGLARQAASERREGLPNTEPRVVSGKLADTNGGNASAEGLQRSGQHGQQQEDGGFGVALGDTNDAGSQGRRVSGADRKRHGGSEQPVGAAGSVDHGGAVVNTEGEQVGLSRRARQPRGTPAGVALGDAKERGRKRQPLRTDGEPALRNSQATSGFWHPADWLPCIDGKARPVEPGTFPLAHGATARVGRLRAYGNAIVAPVAEAFIRAYLERSALDELL